MKTRIYGRFSSKPQERGDSKRQQVEGAKKYASQNGLTVEEEIYFDEGVSGKAGLNLEKEFGRLINDSKSGDNILVMFADRIGRQNPFLTGKLIYDIVQKGVNVIVWGEGRTINQSNINELGTQLGVFTGNAISYGDNQRRIERARLANAETLKKASEGIPTKNLSKYLPSCYVWDEQNKKFDFNKEKAKTILSIFEMYNSGMGTTTIAKELNINNIPCLYEWNKTAKWKEITVRQILKNESYAGTCIPDSNPNIKITCYPPIVSKEVFAKTQLLLERFKNRHGNTTIKTRVNNIFPNLLKCHCCGGNLTVAKTKDGRKTPSYQYYCSNAKYGKCTVKSRRSARPVEVFVMNLIANGDGNNLKAENNKTIEIENQINKIKKAMVNLYDLVETGDTEAKSRLMERKATLAALEKELRKTTAENIETATIPSLKEEIVKKVNGENWKEGITEMKDFYFTLWQRLQNTELRKRLYTVTPSLIARIEVNLPENKFNLVRKGGEVDESNWVDVNGVISKLKENGYKWDERKSNLK